MQTLNPCMAVAAAQLNATLEKVKDAAMDRLEDPAVEATMPALERLDIVDCPSLYDLD